MIPSVTVTVTCWKKKTLSIFFLVSLDQNGDPAEQAELQERTEHWPLARPTYTTRNYTDDARTSHQLHKVNMVANVHLHFKMGRDEQQQ